jgi:hypothetical protein
MLSKHKSAVHQQAAKLFQQHWRHLKGNYDLNSSNGNDIETKAERSFDLDFVFDIKAKRTCLFQNVKIEAKRTLLILHLRKIEAKRILFIPQI